MGDQTIIQIAEIPEAFYGKRRRWFYTTTDINRKLSRYLEARAQGLPGMTAPTSEVKFIPHSPEEQAAWRARKPSDGSTGRRKAPLVTFDSAAAAYSGRPRNRHRSPKPQQGAPATTADVAPVASTGEGVEGTVSPSPDNRPEVGSQVRASKPRRQSPSGTPVQRRMRRNKPASLATFDMQNWDRIIARYRGVA